MLNLEKDSKLQGVDGDSDRKVLRLNPQDNVVIALQDLPANAELVGCDCTTQSPVPRGHKIASQPIASGANVVRYGQIIGQAKCEILPGAHVHSDNLGMGDHKQDYAHASAAVPLEPITDGRTFMGYHRADGRVGTRNYVGIVTTVNCSGSVARFITEAAERAGLLEQFQNIDGIVPIVHGTGCGMSGVNEGYETLFRTTGRREEIQNPNVEIDNPPIPPRTFVGNSTYLIP
ncbi:MAG: UxaA family hydrolase [Pseudomonadota bacterium]|nr:UxaA family hydrolase [Pseudomonadota bacterium]